MDIERRSETTTGRSTAITARSSANVRCHRWCRSTRLLSSGARARCVPAPRRSCEDSARPKESSTEILAPEGDNVLGSHEHAQPSLAEDRDGLEAFRVEPLGHDFGRGAGEVGDLVDRQPLGRALPARLGVRPELRDQRLGVSPQVRDGRFGVRQIRGGRFGVRPQARDGRIALVGLEGPARVPERPPLAVVPDGRGPAAVGAHHRRPRGAWAREASRSALRRVRSCSADGGFSRQVGQMPIVRSGSIGSYLGRSWTLLESPARPVSSRERAMCLFVGQMDDGGRGLVRGVGRSLRHDLGLVLALGLLHQLGEPDAQRGDRPGERLRASVVASRPPRSVPASRPAARARSRRGEPVARAERGAFRPRSERRRDVARVPRAHVGSHASLRDDVADRVLGLPEHPVEVARRDDAGRADGGLVLGLSSALGVEWVEGKLELPDAGVARGEVLSCRREISRRSPRPIALTLFTGPRVLRRGLCARGARGRLLERGFALRELVAGGVTLGPRHLEVGAGGGGGGRAFSRSVRVVASLATAVSSSVASSSPRVSAAFASREARVNISSRSARTAFTLLDR